MRKMILLLAAISALASNLDASTLAGVTLPDTAQVSGTNLVLNGVGLRTKFAFKVYVAGLYLPQKSSDPAAILKPDMPKRIVMHFVRDVSKNQLTDGFGESFTGNTPDSAKKFKSEIDRLFSALEPVKDGQEIIFTYLPGTGTTVTMGDKDKLTIADPAFAELIFSVWLGPKPPNAGLKKGILGQ